MTNSYTKLRKVLETKVQADIEAPATFTWIEKFKNGTGATGVKFKWAKMKAEAKGYNTKIFTVYVNQKGGWHTT